MRLKVEFRNCSRRPEERKKIEAEFIEGALGYCPPVELIHKWRERRHYEYSRVYWAGYFRATYDLTDKEIKPAVFLLTIEK